MKERNEGKKDDALPSDIGCKENIEIINFRGMEQIADFSNNWTQEKIQILFATQGEAYVDCNERQYYIKGKDLVLMNPYEMYFFQALTPELEYYVIRFSPLFFLKSTTSECYEKYIKPITSGSMRFVNFLGEDKKLIEDVERLIDESIKNEAGYEIMIQSLLGKILTNLIRNHVCTQCTKREAECIKKAQSRFLPMFEYIKEHYNEKIQVNDMADFAEVTSCHFCRTFKHISNKTFIDYLNSIRLIQACKQLASSNNTVKQIAITCGFDDMNYFIRIFKKYYKVTPNQFRKIWNKRDNEEGLKENHDRI